MTQPDFLGALVRMGNLRIQAFLEERGFSLNPRKMKGKIPKVCGLCSWRGWVSANRKRCVECEGVLKKVRTG